MTEIGYTFFILPDTNGHQTTAGETVVADVPVVKDGVTAYFGGFWGRHEVPDAICQRQVANLTEQEKWDFLSDNGYTNG